MNGNLYAPPKSDVSVVDGKPGSLLRAVAVGTLIEIVGTFIAGLLIGLVYGVVMASRGVSPEAMQAMLEHLDPGSGFVWISSLAGALVSLLAGYVCARIANTLSYRPALILAGISCTLGTLTGIGSYAWWFLALLAALTACAVLLGARLRIDSLKATRA
ncbi:MAG: hypothetical protein P8178_06735 [Candidatus Thiodiazotropha sp.]